MKKIALIWLCLLTGCNAISLDDSMRELSNANLCCEQLNQIDYQLLDNYVQVDIALSAKSKIRYFNSGSSYFKAFKLKSPTHRVFIQSHVSDNLGTKMGAVYPMVIALNNKFEQLAIIHPQDESQSGMSLHAGEYSKIYVASNLLLPDETSYVIVFSDRFRFGKFYSGEWRASLGLLGPRWFNSKLQWLPQGAMSITFF